MGHVPIELSRLKYVARSESGKMARVLYDKLQEMKEKYMFNDVLKKNEAQSCKLPMDIHSIFITISIISFSFFAWQIREGRLFETSPLKFTIFRKVGGGVYSKGGV